MTLKPIQSNLMFNLAWVLLASLIPAHSALALEATPVTHSLPLLETFVNEVKNGQANELRGVYVPNILAAPIVQQPTMNPAYVSSKEEVLTQFRVAAELGTIGLLAHNFLAGQDFSLMKEGQMVYLVYGDGKVKGFSVKTIMEYEALEPESTTSNFMDLNTGQQLTASELFYEVYDRPGDVVFQTCVTIEGNPSGGRMFVIAEPVSVFKALSLFTGQRR